MPRVNLTFEVVDDLVGAHARGRLGQAPRIRYAPTEICPLIELMMEDNDGRTVRLQTSLVACAEPRKKQVGGKT